MVPRPGSTTPGDGADAEQELEAGAPPIQRSSTATGLKERLSAPYSSEGTYTTGHSASEEEEAYEEQLAVPDEVPPGTTTDFDPSRSPPGRKSAKTEDQKPSMAKGTAKRKVPKAARRKKKMRALNSADESPLSKPAKTTAPREYAPGELECILSQMELARHLERDPILQFLQPKLLSQHTGPVEMPDVTSLTKVRHAVHALFTLLRDSSYVLGVFEIERVYDWGVEAWKQAITGMADPLDALVEVKGDSKPTTDVTSPPKTETTRGRKEPPQKTTVPPTRTAPLFELGEDSGSSVESTKRMPMPARVRRGAGHPAPPPTEAPARCRDEVLPRALEDAIARLMQTPTMRADAMGGSSA
jgi:hypothetical protein